MGSFRTWSSHKVELVDDEGSSKHMTQFEVNHNEILLKPVVSRQGSSASSSSSKSSNHKSELPAEPSSPHPFHLPFATPQEQNQNQNQNQTAAAAGQGYEPNRIPSSIFSSKPATASMEWSTASNESLFSIHLGNNSFSKDQFFMLYKSGDLTKLDEQIMAQADLPPLDVLDEMAKRSESINQGISAAPANISMNSIMSTKSGELAGDPSHQKVPSAQEDLHPVDDKEDERSPRTISISACSDGSNNSTRSFAFPVLTGEGGKANSMKGEQNSNKKGLQTQSQKQHPQPVEQQPAAEEVEQPESPTTPQNAAAAGRSWLSWLPCCGAS